MSVEQSYASLLKQVLDEVVAANQAGRPGTPMAELRKAVEGALGALPPLELAEFERVLDDAEAADRFVQRAPDLIGWNADQIVEWVETLRRRLEA